MLPTMLEDDPKRAGWSIGQAAWRPGVSISEYRGLEAGERLAELGDRGIGSVGCTAGRRPSRRHLGDALTS